MLSSVIRHTRSSANIKAVPVCVGLPAKIFRAILGRVAKSHFFFTEKNLQTKFYPRKSAYIWTILALKLIKTNTKDSFGKQMLTTLSNFKLVCILNLSEVVKIFSKGA